MCFKVGYKLSRLFKEGFKGAHWHRKRMNDNKYVTKGWAQGSKKNLIILEEFSARGVPRARKSIVSWLPANYKIGNQFLAQSVII